MAEEVEGVNAFTKLIRLVYMLSIHKHRGPELCQHQLLNGPSFLANQLFAQQYIYVKQASLDQGSDFVRGVGGDDIEDVGNAGGGDSVGLGISGSLVLSLRGSRSGNNLMMARAGFFLESRVLVWWLSASF